MSISIVVPQLGESVAEGTVARWLKAVGDRVRKEEPLVEIQTDKINVEIPSPAEGVLESISVEEGTTVLVGTEIGVLSGSGAATGAGQAAASKPAAAAQQASAASAPAASPPAPASAATATAAPPRGNGNDVVAVSGGPRNLSPAVRRIMREQNVAVAELGSIAGSGLASRVTRDDLLEYLSTRAAQPPVAAAAAPAAAPARPLPGFLTAATAPAANGAREELVPFTKVRKLIAENMVMAKHTAPHVTTFDEVDMTAVVALKKEWGPKLAQHNVKLTYMPFFIKASVFALKEFPWVNGSVQGDAMLLKNYYNIGMAVGRGEKGLIVPNIKDCDRKNVAQLAAEVNDIASRARNDRLKMEEIQGGSFSITNAGVFGALNSAPIINVPEVAILGVHKITERAVVRDGQIVPRHMMDVALSFDHRVIDGELAVKFLRRVSELLERPELLWFFA